MKHYPFLQSGFALFTLWAQARCLRQRGAHILDTSVGYLLGENEQSDLFKDPVMLKRFQDIATLPEKDRDCLLTTVDHFIKSAKINMM